MKHTKKVTRKLILNREQLRRITGADDGATPDTTDIDSVISQTSFRASCQGTRFCCKPQ
jgi:hypothetical protein